MAGAGANGLDVLGPDDQGQPAKVRLVREVPEDAGEVASEEHAPEAVGEGPEGTGHHQRSGHRTTLAREPRAAGRLS